MLATIVVGFLGPLIDAIDWGKFAIPVGAAAIFMVSYYAASKLAALGVREEIKNLTTRLKNAEDAADLLRTAVASRDVEVATLSTTLKSYLTDIEHRKVAAAEKQAEYNKVFAAGQKFYREAVQLRPARAERDQLAAKLGEAAARIKLLEDDTLTLDDKLKEVKSDLERRRKSIEGAELRMTRAQRLRGSMWLAKALQKRPKFRPLAERKRPIISVLNLKGGVGKTTVTAHLGAALARRGYRVLLVDLDLQGSLSSMMLTNGAILTQTQSKHLLQNFLARAATNSLAKLNEYTVPVPCHDAYPAGALSIVPATQELGYQELNLTLSWLLKKGERDVRFLLRKALHFKLANANYDIVLLDCPPILNISCINALSASDYVLIPTLLSMKATERVPNLIESLQEHEFVTHVNSQLGVLGVVANRSNRTPPAGNEATVWDNLPSMVHSVQKSPVKFFATVLGQDAKITAGEDQFAHPLPGSRAYDMFNLLAAELEKELPHECRIASPVLPQVG